MDINELLGKAINISLEIKFNVIINDILKELNYMELGLFLNTNNENIDKIEITLKE